MNALEPFDLQPDILDRVLHLGVKKTYKRGHLFMDGPSPANLLLYVQKGALRNFFTSGEINLTYWIGVENQFSCAVDFFTGLRGQTFLEAIEPLEVIEIKRDQLLQAYQHDPLLEHFGRLLAEYQLRVLDCSFQILCERSAYNRYQMFLECYPHLNGRIHQKYVASLLKMDQATLSRVRRKKNGPKPPPIVPPPPEDPPVPPEEK